MMWPNMLEITSWFLLTAAMLQTGWSTDKLKITSWETCVPKCECKNVDGRKQTKCENAGMNEIPTGLSDEIQILIFNGNDIGELENNIFTNRGLFHLQKIFLKNCAIKEVHKDAFTGLGLVSHIDLSNNKIKRLDPDTFSQAINLRNVYLNYNSLQRLDNKLFSYLPQLQIVEFNFNHISDIGDRAFFNLPKLKSLQFKNNALVHLKPSIFQLVGNQTLFFDLRNNPWRCDCQLRPFFDYVKNNSFSSPLYCSEPEYMQGSNWELLTGDKFACKPSITLPRNTEIVAQSGEKLILSCRVIGDPEPEMKWFYSGMEGRPLNNETNYGLGIDRKYTIYESGDTTRWCNLTISNFSNSDKGVYRCEARNKAGLDERKVTVTIDEKKVAPTNKKNVTYYFESSANPNLKLNLTFTGIYSSGVKLFTNNPTDETKDRENITATILKQIPNKTLDEKLSIVINQNELLRQKVEQLEAKIEHLENAIPRKNTDTIPAQHR